MSETSLKAPGAHGAMLADRDQTSVAQAGQRRADARRASESEPSKNEPLTAMQARALTCAYEAKLSGDGWLIRDFSGIWQRAPMAVHALARKRLLLIDRKNARARLTDKGLAMIEAKPDLFGLERSR